MRAWLLRCPLPSLIVLLAVTTPVFAQQAAAEPRWVHALDIDRLGPSRLANLRRDPRVEQFVELGDRALVQAAASFVDEQRKAGRLLGSQALRAGEELRVHRRIHCDPEREHDSRPDTFGGDGRWHVTVEPVGSMHGKRLAAPDEVVAWQAANRPAPGGAKAGDDARLAAIAASVDASQWRDVLHALSAYDRQTAAGYNAATAALMDRFAALGLTPRRDCFQSPQARYNQDGRSCNVQAVQRGSNNDWVIVTAHLDSRNATFDDTLASPGAEDNGSGCAGVVEVARVLAAYRTRASILYQCFGLEERGLFGSRAHAPTLTPARVRAVLNMDMIAYDDDGRLDASIETRLAGRGLLEKLSPLAARYTLLEAEFGVETCCSDHVPYLDLGIPAVLLIENDRDPSYHTVNDTAGRLSDAMAREIVKLAAVGAASIAELADPALDATGYWYDPSRSGQGWHFEALAGERFVATWYTFDAGGARLWIVANGSLVDGVATLDAFVAQGGVFPTAAAAAATQNLPWGQLRFRFTDCGHGTVEWAPRVETGLPAGSAQIQRLTPATSGACAAD
jgi:hypothetical protein